MSNETADARNGEELNEASLKRYLAAKGLLTESHLQIKQFRGGFSNLTYLLRSGNEEWVLRRPPFGARGGSAHNMEREYNILKLLSGVYPKAPEPVMFENKKDIIGAPFFVMKRIPGIIVRAGQIPELPKTDAESFFYSLGEQSIRALVELHALEIEPQGVIDTQPDGYTQRQVEGWCKRIMNALTDDVKDPGKIIKWLNGNVPNQKYKSFIHNDFKFDNIVLQSAMHPVEIRGILDWEMAAWGDPLADLGTTLAYWIEPEDNPVLQVFGPTVYSGNLSRVEVIELYAQESGRDLSGIEFYHMLGMFKVAGIVQQIYFRYKKGYTSDKRFAGLGRVVDACLEMIEQRAGL